jgi:predicted cupin superfamily sugar epimerase
VVSRWHRIDGEELWIHQAGSPLTLRIVEHGVAITHTLGLEAAPHILVPPHAWQDAQSDGDWTLVSCVVSPGFDFSTFEMAPVGWSPHEDAP